VISINAVIGDHAYQALTTALLERYAGPLYEIDAGRLLELEPVLRPVEPYVRLVCGHPWLVRRPRDLADLAHCSLRTLKVDCLALGFRRVEHFILYVRAIAYEQLIARGLPARDARRLSGFTDPSNMRRHVRRALRHSPAALKVRFRA
jgi:AraC-like DNA-binding protein